MKRYLVFAGDKYYPAGGFHDFQKSFDSLEDAQEFAKFIVINSPNWDWSHIIDLEEERQIWNSKYHIP